MIECSACRSRGFLWDLRDCKYGARSGVQAASEALRILFQISYGTVAS
jgi:hypothetical protein